MKKLSLILATVILSLLISCSSRWNCQKRYCNAKQEKNDSVKEKNT